MQSCMLCFSENSSHRPPTNMNMGKWLSVPLVLLDSEGLPSREMARGFWSATNNFTYSSWESKCTAFCDKSTARPCWTEERWQPRGYFKWLTLRTWRAGQTFCGGGDFLDLLGIHERRIAERRDILKCKMWGEKWWVISRRRCKGCQSRLWMMFYEELGAEALALLELWPKQIKRWSRGWANLNSHAQNEWISGEAGRSVCESKYTKKLEQNVFTKDQRTIQHCPANEIMGLSILTFSTQKDTHWWDNRLLLLLWKYSYFENSTAKKFSIVGWS